MVDDNVLMIIQISERVQKFFVIEVRKIAVIVIIMLRMKIEGLGDI